MISLILFGIILPVVGFIFESYPRFIKREFGVDIWTHLLYLKEYHRQKGIPKKIENGFLVTGTYDYPPVFIEILSKFPYKLVERYEFIFSPFFDFLHIILIFFFSYIFTQSILISLTVQLLYILTPIIVIENSSATPRSLGYTLFTLVMVSLFMYAFYGQLLYLFIAFISGSLIFLTHRFTTQGFLFFSLFFSIIQHNIIYILTFILCFMSAIILSKGFYLEVLKGHLGNLKFWYKNIKYRFAHQVRGNYKKHKTKDFVFSAYNQFLKFPPFVLAITNPWTIPPLLLYILTLYLKISFSPIIDYMVLWVVFSYVLSLLTIWIPKLRFLGEGQRYLELSAYPAALISSMFLFNLLRTGLSFYALIIYTTIGVLAFLTIVVIQRKAIIKEKLRALTPDLKRMFSFLKGMKNKPKLLCIPHQITTNTIYHTGCKVFVNADYKNIEKISDVYPYIKKPISQIMKNYSLDMILLNSDYAKIEDLKLNKYKIIKQIGNFYLIKP